MKDPGWFMTPAILCIGGILLFFLGVLKQNPQEIYASAAVELIGSLMVWSILVFEHYGWMK